MVKYEEEKDSIRAFADALGHPDPDVREVALSGLEAAIDLLIRTVEADERSIALDKAQSQLKTLQALYGQEG